MPESVTRDWHCLESMHQSLEYRLGSMSKTLGRNYFFQAGNISNLLNSTGKKLERQEGVHEYYDIMSIFEEYL